MIVTMLIVPTLLEQHSVGRILSSHMSNAILTNFLCLIIKHFCIAIINSYCQQFSANKLFSRYSISITRYFEFIIFHEKVYFIVRSILKIFILARRKQCIVLIISKFPKFSSYFSLLVKWMVVGLGR